MSIALPRLIFPALLIPSGSCHRGQPVIHNLSLLAVSGLDLPKLCTGAHHSAWEDVPEEQYVTTFCPFLQMEISSVMKSLVDISCVPGCDLVDNCTLKESLEYNSTRAEILLLFLKDKDKTQNVSENIENKWLIFISVGWPAQHCWDSRGYNLAPC